MRADRLVSILLLLQTKGQATTAELAKRLEVSERTIHRDMEALTAAGVPVYAERGSGGGWRLLEAYRTDLTGLSEAEIMSLFALQAPQLIRDLGLGKAGENALIKLLAALPASQRKGAEYARQRIFVDIQRYQEAVPLLPVLQEAVWRDRKLWLLYSPNNAQPAERIVEPLGLVVRGNVWYLIASREGERRSYRVSRILEAKVLDQAAQRPADFDLESYWKETRAEFKSHMPTYRIRVHIEERVLQNNNPVGFWGQVEETTPLVDGWLEAQIRFEFMDKALSWVLSTGLEAKITEPPELLERLQQTVNQMVQKLTKPPSC